MRHVQKIDFNIVPVSISELTSKQLNVWESKDVILNCLGGLPDSVREIVITELFCNSIDQAGEFRAWEGKIIIHRFSLRTKAEFLSVFLHEMAHARCGYGDLTEGFENELTNLLGILGEQLCKLIEEKNTEIKQSEPKNIASINIGLKCRCMQCGDSDFETNLDRTYAKCKICGKEYFGGYKELINLNREYILKYGIESFRNEIAAEISKKFKNISNN